MPRKDTFSVLVCRFPGNWQEHPASASYVMALIANHKTGRYAAMRDMQPCTIVDTPITMSRNRACKIAIEKGYDYILMIDADMWPDLYHEGPGAGSAPAFFDVAWQFMMQRRKEEEDYKEQWEAAVQRGHQDMVHQNAEDAAFYVIPPATIAAPYCGPPPEELCYVFEWKNMGDQPADFRLGMIPRDSVAIRSGIQEVAALPTGLILYDARVFLRLPPPWYDYEYTDDFHVAKDSTEDVVQTRNASQLGMPQFCAWDCWAGHVKLKTVGKPTIYTPEIVSKKLAQAIRNPNNNARILFRTEENGVAQTGPAAKPAAINPIPPRKVAQERCKAPPSGWLCTREAGHDGPCAAVQAPIISMSNSVDTTAQAPERPAIPMPPPSRK